MTLHLTWIRPTETTSGAPIDDTTVLSYEVHTALGPVAVGTELAEETMQEQIPLQSLGDVTGKYVFVRAKTSNGTLSKFSNGVLVGVPVAPTALMVEDI